MPIVQVATKWIRNLPAALMGVEERWNGDRKKLTAWIKNSSAFLKTGDKYANDLYLEYNKIAMNSYEGVLDDAQIASILDYIRDWKPVVAAIPGSGGTQTANAGGDNTLLFGILTLILALVALTLLQVNSNLRKISNEKTGIPTSEPIPFLEEQILHCHANGNFICYGWIFNY